MLRLPSSSLSCSTRIPPARHPAPSPLPPTSWVGEAPIVATETGGDAGLKPVLPMAMSPATRRTTVLSCPGGRSRRRQRRQILWMIHHLRLPPVPVLIRRSITRSYGNTAGNRGERHGSSTGAVYPRLRPSPVGRREIDRAGSVEFGHEQDQRGFGELADVVPAGNCVRSNCTSASSFDAPPTLRVAAAP